MINVSAFPLETKRLKMRAWHMSDINDLFHYASVEGVGEMAGWPHHLDIHTSQKVLESFIHNDNVYALVMKSTEKAIGSLGIHASWASEDERFKALNVLEIGYVIGTSYWGNGFVPEAVQAVLHTCFETWNLDAATCGHFDGNHQSRRVIEKCGFQYIDSSEKTLDQLDNKKVILHRYIKFK